ncbi:MAG: hypothetical protein ACI4XB_02700 [Ruminococcus sp.]
MKEFNYLSKENKEKLEDFISTGKSPKIVFQFERGAFFSGLAGYTISEYDEIYRLQSRFSNDFWKMKNHDFFFPKEAMQGLKSSLEPVRKWRKNYKDYRGILDGFGWSIQCSFDNMKLNSEGYENYPDDYKEVVRKIQQEIELLCQTYDPLNYFPEDAEKRLEL